MPTTTPAHSRIRSAVARASKAKLLATVGFLGALGLLAIVIISLLFSALAAPAQALQGSIQWLFGTSAESGSDPNPTDTELLRRCIGIDATVLEPVVRSVPAGTEPNLAHGWILYALAHPTSVAVTDTTAEVAVAESADSVSEESQSDEVTFDVFATRWPHAASVIDGDADADERAELVPATLRAIDPGTNYEPYGPAGLVAVLELSYRGIIPIESSGADILAGELTESCPERPEETTATTK